MKAVELYRSPILFAEFEEIKSVIGVGAFIWVPSRAAHASRTGINSQERFDEYCKYMFNTWGDGDLVVTHEHDHQITITFDNAEYKRMYDKVCQECLDYYASKPSGGFTGD